MKTLAWITLFSALASATQLGLYPIPGLQKPAKREIAEYVASLKSVEKKWKDTAGTPELTATEKEAVLTAIRQQITQAGQR